MVWDRLMSAGKKAVGKAKEYDDKMVERHGDDSDALDQLTGDSRRGSMQSPDMALGLDDDSDRYENDMPMAFGMDNDEKMDTDSPRLGELGFAGDSDGDDAMTPGVPDMMGENDRDDRLW